jgi:hypothetical protein
MEHWEPIIPMFHCSILPLLHDLKELFSHEHRRLL